MSLIIGGRETECDVEVSDSREHGLRFRPWMGCKPRRQLVSTIVVHWTGGEPKTGARTTYEVLKRRRLSVEFAIDRAGLVWQFADPVNVECFHAGSRVNPRSIGIEVICYGMRKLWRQIPTRGRDREVYECRIRGANRKCAAFYPAQQEALEGLCDALTDHLPDIPRTVCLEPHTLSRAEVAQVTGVVGHFQLSRRKTDPGMRPLELLADHFNSAKG